MRVFTFRIGVDAKKKRTDRLPYRVGLLFAALIAMSTILVPVAQAAPGDYNWQKAGLTGVVGEKQIIWQSIASSDDGNKLAAAPTEVANNAGAYIYTSSDSGATWTERTAAGKHSWISISSSADGVLLAAAERSWNGSSFAGSIYTSSDSGATWTERTGAGSRWWTSVDSSSDGSRLVASVVNGFIYTSSDSGATWTERTAAGARVWSSVTTSNDGTRIAAGVGTGYIYTSSDSGATWTERTAAGSRNWKTVASSSDGSKLVASMSNGYIYRSSDSGATWNSMTGAGSRNWSFITTSSDGTKLAGVVARGYIYTSSDSGATWTERTGAGSHFWIAAASSGDGEKLVVGQYNGSLYTTSNSGESWIPRTVNGTREWRSIISSDDGTKLAATEYSLENGNVYEGYIYTSSDSGATWTERTSAGPRVWDSIASSSNGTHLVAGVGSWYSSDSGNHYGYIYTSSDSGATWTERTAAGLRGWNSVAISNNGTNMVAASATGFIYTSSDSGATWTERTSAGSQYWSQVISSDDGSKLLAGVDGGLLYHSVDFGLTWTPITSLNNEGGWYSLAMSPDGKTLFAADAYGSDYNGGYAYISKDSGVTWQQQTNLGLRYWNASASASGAISDDGQTIAIADMNGSDWNDWNGGYIYVTRDGGATWHAQTDTGARKWSSITLSSDGSKIAAGISGGNIYLANLEPPITDTFNLATLSDATQSAIHTAITGAQISVTSETCYTLEESSIATMSNVVSAVPEANADILGGIAFNVSCVSAGGTSEVGIALGSYYADTSTLRAYKSTGSGASTILTDITDQVSFVNTDASGTMKTVLSYQLADGGDFDEDSTANGTIVDPIYIGLVNDASLAATGTNIWLLALGATVLVGGGSLTLHKLARKR